MNLNQHTSEVRKQTAAELGKGFSDQQAKAKESQIRQIGAKEALEAASKNQAEMIGLIRAGWKDNGIIEGFSKEELEKMSAEVQKAIVQGQIAWVQRCVGALDALVIQCDQAIIMAGAKVKAFKEAEDQVKAVFEQEAAKQAAVQKAIEDGTLVKNDDGEYVLAPGKGESPNSVVGIHPGLTEKQKRLAEEKAEREAKAKEGAETPTEPSKPEGDAKALDEPSQPSAELAETKEGPKKRLRPKAPEKKGTKKAPKTKRSRRKKD